MAEGRPARSLLAMLLVAAAIAVVAVAVPEGPTLVSLTRTHGVHAGDLPVIALLLLAALVGIARDP